MGCMSLEGPPAVGASRREALTPGLCWEKPFAPEATHEATSESHVHHIWWIWCSHNSRRPRRTSPKSPTCPAGCEASQSPSQTCCLCSQLPSKDTLRVQTAICFPVCCPTLRSFPSQWLGKCPSYWIWLMAQVLVPLHSLAAFEEESNSRPSPWSPSACEHLWPMAHFDIYHDTVYQFKSIQRIKMFIPCMSLCCTICLVMYYSQLHRFKVESGSEQIFLVSLSLDYLGQFGGYSMRPCLQTCSFLHRCSSTGWSFPGTSCRKRRPNVSAEHQEHEGTSRSRSDRWPLAARYLGSWWQAVPNLVACTMSLWTHCVQATWVQKTQATSDWHPVMPALLRPPAEDCVLPLILVQNSLASFKLSPSDMSIELNESRPIASIPWTKPGNLKPRQIDRLIAASCIVAPIVQFCVPNSWWKRI